MAGRLNRFCTVIPRKAYGAKLRVLHTVRLEMRRRMWISEAAGSGGRYPAKIWVAVTRPYQI